MITKVIHTHYRRFGKYQRAENNHKYKHPGMTGTFECISMEFFLNAYMHSFYSQTHFIIFLLT